MADIKTKKTAVSAADFLATIADAQTRSDCQAIAKLMQGATKAAPEMWGPSIVGFGHRVLVYPNGRELDWMEIGFSPRKAAITLYFAADVLDSKAIKSLGTYTTGKGCLYLKRLSDVDRPTLKALIEAGVRKSRHPTGPVEKASKPR